MQCQQTIRVPPLQAQKDGGKGGEADRACPAPPQGANAEWQVPEEGRKGHLRLPPPCMKMRRTSKKDKEAGGMAQRKSES